MNSRLLSILVGLVVSMSGFAADARRANVVVFLADDAGWGDFSINGNLNVRTPRIDSIGLQGAQMDRFFVCSVCAPTRAAFFTGRYHTRAGVRGVSTGLERLNLDERTIGDVFKSAGYATGAFGKWHNGSQWPYHPNARGFDEYVGFTSGHWGEYFDPPLERNGQPERGKGYVADIFTDEAIQFIDRNKARPFFCYVPFNTPHSPWAVPDEYWQRFKEKEITMRGRLGEREDLAATRCALAMIENMDWNVGRVLKKLDELNLGTNTIVVFFSDNGPNTPRWNGGMKGIKGSVDEGGLRSPLLIRWTGQIQPGTVVREIAGAIDLLPTLARLSNVPLNSAKPLDGKDLSPLLLKTAANWPDRKIFIEQNGRIGVRTQRYRLDDQGALFDMVNDPNQSRNVAASETEIAAELTKAVSDWRAEVMAGRSRAARPYPVAYREFPRTPLPARDGIPNGGIRRSAGAPNCSYFVNWRSTNDFMTWDIQVNTEGDYEVTVLHTCPESAIGAVIQLEFGDIAIRKTISTPWDPPLYTNQDTIPRPPGESKMKEFRPLSLGTMHLKKGRGLLTLRGTEIPNNAVMDVRQIDLKLQSPR